MSRLLEQENEVLRTAAAYLSQANLPGKTIFPLVREMAATGARIRVPVAVACRVLGLTAQRYYTWRKEPVGQRDWDDAHAIDALLVIHQDESALGYRFLTDELADVGIVASENRVAAVLDRCSLRLSHTPERSKAGKPGPPVHGDLLAVVEEKGRLTHDFTADRPNQKWLTDITERPTAWAR